MLHLVLRYASFVQLATTVMMLQKQPPFCAQMGNSLLMVPSGVMSVLVVTFVQIQVHPHKFVHWGCTTMLQGRWCVLLAMVEGSV